MTLSVLSLSTEEHDEFVRRHPNGHLMQTTAWGREKEHTGWSWKTVAVGSAGEIRGVALILFRRTPVLPMALAYVPRGFVLDWADSEAIDAVVAEVSRVAKADRGVLLRLDPAVSTTDRHARPALERRGFTRTDPGDDPARSLAQPALRMVTDISDLDALHKQLSQGTRWSIRKAGKSGLVYESVGRDKIPAFHELMRTTGERDGFGIRSMGYFTTLYDVLSPTDEIIVSLVRLDPGLAIEGAEKLRTESTTQLEKLHRKQAAAEQAGHKQDPEKQARQVETLEKSISNAEGVIEEFAALKETEPQGRYVAGSIFAINGSRGSYLYAASSDEHRNLRPNYLMVWTLMQKAAERGVTSFDFGGIDAAEGLEEFKRQWEPERREYVGEFSKRLRPLTGRLIELAVSLYKRR